MDLREKKELKNLLSSKAEMLKAISNPIRLCILAMLFYNNSSNVTDLQCCIEVSQPTISQHLAKLKAADIIKGERHKNEIIYSIKNNEVKQIIKLIAENGLS